MVRCLWRWKIIHLISSLTFFPDNLCQAVFISGTQIFPPIVIFSVVLCLRWLYSSIQSVASYRFCKRVCYNYTVHEVCKRLCTLWQKVICESHHHADLSQRGRHKNVYTVYSVERVSKIKSIHSCIIYAIYVAVRFQLSHSPFRLLWWYLSFNLLSTSSRKYESVAFVCVR